MVSRRESGKIRTVYREALQVSSLLGPDVELT